MRIIRHNNTNNQVSLNNQNTTPTTGSIRQIVSTNEIPRDVPRVVSHDDQSDHPSWATEEEWNPRSPMGFGKRLRR